MSQDQPHLDAAPVAAEQGGPSVAPQERGWSGRWMGNALAMALLSLVGLGCLLATHLG